MNYRIIKPTGEVICKRVSAEKLADKLLEINTTDYLIEEIKKKLPSNTRSEFSKAWIIRHGLPIVRDYGSTLTLRSLHYALVSKGMTNDENHYKKVITSMIEARWEGLINFDAFVDHERETLGSTDYDLTDPESSSVYAKKQIKAWGTSYKKNRWENQLYYPEIFIEKKALQGVFEDKCRRWDVALNPCKGYPSLTFLYDSKCRFEEAIKYGKVPVIFYFGDYDCSGEDIPRSLAENLEKMGIKIDLRRVALMEDQVIDWDLPPAPTKVTDRRAANWDGLGQVELDALHATQPTKINELLEESLESIFDRDRYNTLLEEQASELITFKEIIKRDFHSLLD